MAVIKHRVSRQVCDLFWNNTFVNIFTCSESLTQVSEKLYIQIFETQYSTTLNQPTTMPNISKKEPKKPAGIRGVGAMTSLLAVLLLLAWVCQFLRWFIGYITFCGIKPLTKTLIQRLDIIIQVKCIL